ncbi:PulJ/GspJ family protein [Bradyrhizobium liaoningense]
MMYRTPRRAEDGFTLFEALVALALMGLIMGALASVTSQWLPSWNRGIVRAQLSEGVAIALDRLATDLSAAEYVTRTDNTPLFRGTEQSVTFVRSVLGPNSRPGLEIVRISEINDRGVTALVRMRAPFVLLSPGDPRTDQIQFVDPVVLLRLPYRVSFSYAAPDGSWDSRWLNAGQLPEAVRFDVRDAERGTVISSAARIHVDRAAPRPDPSVLQEAPRSGNRPT